MKKNLLRNIFILILSSSISITSIYVISEKFFFEKFFENKSIAHGYWPENKKLTEADFGERGKDVINLRNNQKLKIDDSNMNIAFISDSFGWGNGVRFKKTVSQQLESNLARLGISNEVFSLSMGGDSMLDHLAKVDILEKNNKNIDVYVFLIVSNDLLLRPSDNFYQSEIYFKIILECQSENPNEQITRHPSWDSTEENKQLIIENNYLETFSSHINNCIFEKSLDSINKILKDKSIFIISDYNEEKSKEWSHIIEILNKYQIKYIDPTEGKNLPKYSQCWENDKTLKQCFWVTKNDSHPSVKLHKMYSEILANHDIIQP